MRSGARPAEHYNRDAVVAATDLPTLLDQVIGPHRGRGGSASWACPDPAHGPQTGRTPPVSAYLAHGREQRWHCHGCGADGTAIDLIMLTQGCSFVPALQTLAEAARLTSEPVQPRHLRTAKPVRADPPTPPGPNPHLIAYVNACEAILRTSEGAAVRAWLHDRGLQDPVLQANRVGADPGPARLPRHPGLPRGGPAAVFPVLDQDGTPIYLQARYLNPRGSKYANPSSSLTGPSPRLAVLRPPTPPSDRQTILVCEGIPDGLTAVQAGVRACAVLGAAAADEALAARLAHRYPGRHLVLAFDIDDAGRAGKKRLASALDAYTVDVSSFDSFGGIFNDLNDLVRSAPDALSRLMSGASQANLRSEIDAGRLHPTR